MNCDIDYKNRVYEAFAVEAGKNGYNKAEPEEIVLPSDITIDVQGGVAGQDTGSPGTKTFFNSTTADAVVQVQDPPIKYQQSLGGEFLACIFAFALQWDPQTYAGTLTETREVKAALARALLHLQFGSDRVFNERGRACLWDGAGSPLGNDGTTTGTAATTSRGEAIPLDYKDMSSPRVLGSTQQLVAQLILSVASWTTDNDVTVSCLLKCFLARKG